MTVCSIASTILMVPPTHFKFNLETAASNSYQQNISSRSINKKVMNEFNNMVETLVSNGVNVLILHQDKDLPDAVFPNNWFSLHINSGGKISLILYPMLSKNRQEEVNVEGVINILRDNNIHIEHCYDLRNKEGHILEGTGSLVLDRENQIIYASLSLRTHPFLIQKVAEFLNYQTVIFNSVDCHHRAIYHTNVMMSIAKQYAVVCLDSIKHSLERSTLISSLQQTKKQIIALSEEQTNQMCANVLELNNKSGESLLVLSSRAYKHFTKEQLHALEKYSRLLPIDLDTIETIGGGSARCMMAEIVHL